MKPTFKEKAIQAAIAKITAVKDDPNLSEADKERLRNLKEADICRSVSATYISKLLKPADIRYIASQAVKIFSQI